MSPAELARLAVAVRIVEAKRARTSSKPFIPHAPHPRQQAFLDLPCMEAFYGGAAGGGKSDALLMAALEHVHVPRYSALLLRRTYADLSLPGAIMDRAQTWLQGKAKWNGQDKRWTFPSGATLTFGYLDTEKDKYRYASAEFQFIGFDEVTQFPEGWYRFLLSRLRRTEGLAVPLRARSAGNPGGLGHAWVKRRFVDSTGPECVFVPANLSDNPSLDAVEYRKSLAQLDENTRRQLEDGVWVQDAGGLVYRYDAERNSVAAAPPLTTYLLGMDYGYTDDCAFTVLGWRDHDPTVYVVESYRKSNMLTPECADEAKALSDKYQPVKIVGDMAGKAYVEEIRRRHHLPVEAAEKQNKRGYQTLINGDLERGRIKVVRATCADLTKEWSELPWTEDHAKEADGFDNHCSDATLYAWRAANAFFEEPAPEDATPEQRIHADIWEKRVAAIEASKTGAWWETM